MYEYKARVVRIIDGDSLKVMVDLGFSIHVEQFFRLFDYQAPELRNSIEKPLAIIAKEELEKLIPVDTEIIFCSKGKDKYGRWLADIAWKEDSLSKLLIEQGFGVYWNGKGDRPTFDPQEPYPLKAKEE